MSSSSMPSSSSAGTSGRCCGLSCEADQGCTGGLGLTYFAFGIALRGWIAWPLGSEPACSSVLALRQPCSLAVASACSLAWRSGGCLSPASRTGQSPCACLSFAQQSYHRELSGYHQESAERSQGLSSHFSTLNSAASTGGFHLSA